MVALLTPEVSAMASMLVASKPREASRLRAASITLRWAFSLRGRGISDLDPGEEAAADDEEHRGVYGRDELGVSQERGAEAIDSVGERVEPDDEGERRGQVLQRVEGAGEEEDGHHEEVHDELEALHVFERGADGGAQGGEGAGDQRHEEQRNGQRRRRGDAEAGDEADGHNEQPLQHGHGSGAESAAEHDVEAGDRSHQRLFEKAELPVPEQAHAGEDGTEQDGHADHPGSDELEVAALSGLLKDGTETE